MVARGVFVKAVVEAIFADGVFRPKSRPELREGEFVRLTFERATRGDPEEILGLAKRVYEGLTQRDIDEIEDMARHRPLFDDSR